MIVGITGNRWIYKNKLAYDFCIDELSNAFKAFNPSKVISGMAIGVDSAAVDVCIKQKIPYVCAVPFIGQELFWPEDVQNKYKNYLSQSDDVVVVSPGGYAAWKMQKRNEWIVDNCDILLAFYDYSLGGTKNCINYANTKNKNVKIIDISTFK
jgi:uncharacterized phage-like protein YoqJ